MVAIVRKDSNYDFQFNAAPKLKLLRFQHLEQALIRLASLVPSQFLPALLECGVMFGMTNPEVSKYSLECPAFDRPVAGMVNLI